MIDIAALRAAGMPAERILDLVENWLSAKKEKERNRVKKYYSTRKPRNTRRNENVEQDQDSSTRITRNPPYPLKEESKILFLDSASQSLPSAPERKAVTEFDLVLSDGSTVIVAEEFQALNEEFGISNSRDLAGTAKRTFLKDVRDGRRFVSAFRTFLTNKSKRPKAAKPTKAQQQDIKDDLYLKQLEQDRRYAAKQALDDRRRSNGSG